MLQLQEAGKTDRSCPTRLTVAVSSCGSIPEIEDKARHCWRNPGTGQAGSHRSRAVPIKPSRARKLPAQAALNPVPHASTAIGWLRVLEIRVELHGFPA